MNQHAPELVVALVIIHVLTRAEENVRMNVLVHVVAGANSPVRVHVRIAVLVINSCNLFRAYMTNKESKKELLHRREFFRKAVKGMLPIVAVIAAPSLFVNCEEDSITDCSDCSNTCSSSCTGQSSTSVCNCGNTCGGGCYNTCSGSCKNGSTNESENDIDEEGLSKATGSVDGYSYVDLGLSVKWAMYNIGASKPQQYGSYLEFTEGAASSNYREVRLSLIRAGFQIGDAISGTSFDPVRDKWGSKWKMPTEEDFEELVDNCNYEILEYESVLGIKFTSKINGRSIFLPAAGRIDIGTKKDVGKIGYYWNGTLQYIVPASISVYCIRFGQNYLYQNHSPQIENQKYSIRPVTNEGGEINTCGGTCSANCASNSTNSTCSGCASTCSGGCKTGCSYNCAATCDSHCYGNCNDSCGGTCKYLNASSNCSGCAQTCYNRCYHGCDYACSSNCQSSCVNGTK